MTSPLDTEKGSVNVGTDFASSSTKVTRERGVDTDLAYEYLVQKQNINDHGAINLQVLRRKVDWHIMPIMSALYTMTFIDKILINVCTKSGSIQT